MKLESSESTQLTLLTPSRLAWIFLDWAASAFSAILITLVVTYVEKFAFSNGEWGVAGGVVWAWIIATTMFASAIITPWLSAWADRKHAHQNALLGAVLLGSIACFALAMTPTDWRFCIAVSIVLAGIGFEMGAVFAGSLLPRLASGPAADRLSAAGFACGYAGGALALILATSVVATRESFGLSLSGSLRVSFAIMGGWWFIFSLPAMFIPMGQHGTREHKGTSTAELLAFTQNVLLHQHGRHLRFVLIGSMLVIGAVQTAIAQFSSVAIEEFQMDPQKVVQLVLLVQFIALPGALGVGWLSTNWNRHGALVLCLTGWATVLVLSWFIQTQPQLYALAGLLALVLGGIQSVIRATVATWAPEGHYGATFGLFQVGTKLAGCAASVAFGVLYALSGHPRAGLLALLVQLLIGWLVLRYAMPRTSRIE